MSFTRFAVRILVLIAIVFLSGYLYTIYCALTQNTITTLESGKRYIVHPDLLIPSGLSRGEIGIPTPSATSYTHYSLINPRHTTVSTAPLADTDLVVGIVMPDGSACAYSYALLLWHHVINDVVGTTPIVIAMCPFTDTVTSFIASIHNDIIYFGVSSMVYLGSLILYDQKTNSSWSLVDGRVLVGPMSGFNLEQLPVTIMHWKQWRILYPNTGVVSNYDDADDRADPYCKLYMHPEHNLCGTFFTDTRLLAQTPVIGLVIGDTAVAYSVEKISIAHCIQDAINGVPILATSCGLPYQASTYPTMVFDRRVHNKPVYFIDTHGHMQDTCTRSLWNYQGYAYAGPMAGTQLKRIAITCTTWFTWSLFYPATRVY